MSNKKKVESFFNQNNINIITAPANDHRAIGLVERVSKTSKGSLGCMKLANKNNKFTFKESKRQ